jgi:maltose alpha-D-glucosyltransferase/alpha-amylase
MGEISTNSAAGKTTLAMLQGLVSNEGDGWAWFLRNLQEFYAKAGLKKEALNVPNPEFGHSNPPPDEIASIAGPTLAAAMLLGRRTAEMHLALSCSADDPAFAPEDASRDDLATDVQQIEAQVRTALEVLKAKFSSLDDAVIDAAALLLAKRTELIDRSRAIRDLQGSGKRIRIHGDYHLGQTLRTPALPPDVDGDFVLLDFEGEPARPLAQRRRKQSPLKDVAGMLRSFSYAAFAALMEYRSNQKTSERQPYMEEWSRAWENCASADFLRGYREAITGKIGLLPSALETQALLEAFILEKSLYELLYELNNRPTWIPIPIAGILSLCK